MSASKNILSYSIVAAFAALLLVSCAEGPAGGPVGGLVLQPPKRMMKTVVDGQVTCEGKGLADVVVEVRKSGDKTITDEQGYFHLHCSVEAYLSVSSARVHVTASAEGYRTRTKGLKVREGQTSELFIQLLPRK